MSNALDELQDFCEFGPERVYLLVAIARPKDNPGVTSGTAPVIKRIVEDRTDLVQKSAALEHAVSRFDERYRLYLNSARNSRCLRR